MSAFSLRLPGLLKTLARASAVGAGLLFFLTGTAGISAKAADAAPFSDRWAVEYTSGVLWSVGGGASPLDYVIAPQILSVLCPAIREWPLAGGALVYRARLSLLLEPIIKGPETHYIGTAAAADVEWRHPSGNFSCFFAAGGGYGLMDSRGYDEDGAQGQDFNLNWLVHGGVRFRTRGEWQWSAGLYFQHISNRDMDDVNPGINALGPTLGLSRAF